MRWLLLGIGLVTTAVVVILVVGWSLPVEHVASRSEMTRASPAEVFALVSQVEEYPRWRNGVSRVEVLASDDAGRPLRFREHGVDGAILYEVMEREPDRRMVVRIADTTLPFGGRWAHEITPNADGATLSITEEGAVYNPAFRFMSRFVFGHASTIDRYLRDVSARLNASRVPEP